MNNTVNFIYYIIATTNFIYYVALFLLPSFRKLFFLSNIFLCLASLLCLYWLCFTVQYMYKHYVRCTMEEEGISTSIVAQYRWLSFTTNAQVHALYCTCTLYTHANVHVHTCTHMYAVHLQKRMQVDPNHVCKHVYSVLGHLSLSRLVPRFVGGL